jgi:hypothetical protein
VKFHHDAAPVTRLPLRNRRDRPNCCACFDCSGSKGFSRSREKAEWRRGLTVPHGSLLA